MDTLFSSSRSKFDFDDGNLISEQKGSQIQSFSIPVTPVKPNLPKPHLIYLNQQENHEIGEESKGFSSGFGQKSCLEINGDVNNWEIALAGKFQVPGGDSGENGQFCFDVMDRWNNKPWIDFPLSLQMTQCDRIVPSSSEIQIAPITPDKCTHGPNQDKLDVTSNTEITELEMLIDEAIGLDTTPQQKLRRRKHRPKVITQGKQPKRHLVATSTASKENSSGKRKYGRDKVLNIPTKSPPSEVGENSDRKTYVSARKSARRALNFEIEHKINESSAPKSSAHADPKSNEQGYDIFYSTNEKLNANSGLADDEMEIRRLMAKEKYIRNEKKKLRWGEDFGNSKCHTRQTTAKQKGLQKLNAITQLANNDELDMCQVMANEKHCRSEKTNLKCDEHVASTCPGISKYQTRQTTARQKNIAHDLVMEDSSSAAHYKHLNPNGPVLIDDFDNRVSSKPNFPIIHQRRSKKEQTVVLDVGHNDKLPINNRLKSSTQFHDLDSDVKFSPISPRKETQLNGVTQGDEVSHRARTGKEVVVAESSSRNIVQLHRNKFIYSQHKILSTPIGSSMEVKRKHKILVDAVTERLRHLDINVESNIVSYEEKSLLLPPCNARYQSENLLVLYRKDGNIVPFEGSFFPIRRRRQRPKVNLDDETTRVWKLLLENISNEGIDGSNEKNAKWWEEERNVFRGRADSFIARMHLVQGDRRFSQWKGSVLDSVVGVFLTQNVSDHLSSSAFMSLAAHFSLKPDSNNATHILVKEPELCVVDIEDTVDLRETMPENLVGDLSASPGSASRYKEYQEIADSSESFGSIPCILSSHESTTQNSEQKMSFTIEEKSVMEDVILCESSVESSLYETVEISGKRTESNSEAQDSTIGTQSTNLNRPSSLLELLQIAIDPEFNKCDLYETLMKEFDKSLGDAYIPLHQTANDKQSQNFSAEISDITESSGALYYQKNFEDNVVEPNLKQHSPSEKREKVENEKNKDIDWDSLRKQAQANGIKERTANTVDSLDWEAVRCADVDEVAHTIRGRGMNNKLAERIKDFLDRLKREHGSLDLEWLRDVPPDKAKEFLLSFRGLGLKSVECVRLLTLHQLAFPVDTNVGRIAVRLGWVPLQPLPESLQLHLLELYPVMESIQKYLWPRLCKLDQLTLYELHYQMITFGKVFCTKTKPNCNACPLRGDCRHFASAFASARLALPGPEEKSLSCTTEQQESANPYPYTIINKLQLLTPQLNQQTTSNNLLEANQPFETKTTTSNNEPIIEVPVTPESECTQILECDIEDLCLEDPDEIPMIKLDIEEFTQNLQHYMQNNMELQEGEMSRALVALTPEAASIPTPKLKYINRLRTEHHVYELPDSHPLVEGLDRRELDDPCSYLLAIWTPGETANSIQRPEASCSSQEDGKLCSKTTCFSCNSAREANSQTVRGTLLIPCRTALRGSFPLNGTYFQVNEVFADHDSSLSPIDVPRAWIWNLRRRTVFFGTSIPTIFRGLTTEAIQYCFWRGDIKHKSEVVVTDFLSLGLLIIYSANFSYN